MITRDVKGSKKNVRERDAHGALAELRDPDRDKTEGKDICQRTPTTHTWRTRGRSSSPETKKRTVRQQQPASPAQRDWSGHNPSVSSHVQTRPQQAGSGRDVNPDLLLRDAYELSAWAETNQENKNNKRHHCSHDTERWRTRRAQQERLKKRMEPRTRNG